ncbi:ubiquitin-conjugating enzyme E2 2-like isoform X1 [Hibiscus syriacus]|uniref:Ubiquitin-conjugating enzyme E2 2-like isoform X1 n=1 Tax=Hibiscus syriacus TaxID=106335 RepID=A0A6A2XVI7_HIBSY|nr:ubiquitin-conjugating enzyme E2 2-like isoform X1 [Hibiscus syriacus]
MFSGSAGRSKIRYPLRSLTKPKEEKPPAVDLSNSSSSTASKHSVSLGFFNLALEAGCEPLQKIADELKSYVRRLNLGENEEAIKELIEHYNVLEIFDQPQVPGEGTRSSDDEVHRVSPSAGARRLKPKSLNSAVAQASSVAKSAKQATPKHNAASSNRYSNKTSSNSRSDPDTGRAQQIIPSAAAETAEEENKENSDVPPLQDAPLTEESSLEVKFHPVLGYFTSLLGCCLYLV